MPRANNQSLQLALSAGPQGLAALPSYPISNLIPHLIRALLPLGSSHGRKATHEALSVSA